MAKMKKKEKKCKSILSESGLYGIDYSLNPYTGCEHGCKYCYATFMKKFSNHSENWGEFVDIKTNAVKILENDLRKKEKGSILLSSVTDPYQPVEKKYEITRNILKRLSNTEYPVTILTKSDLILRDLEILKEFEPENITVGFTINFLKERDRKIWEPKASDMQNRIKALRKISEKEIECYVHVGPYFEGITELEEIMEKTGGSISELQIETINLKDRSKKVLKIIERHYPELSSKYEKISNDCLPYQLRLKEKVDELRNKTNTRVRLFLD